MQNPDWFTQNMKEVIVGGGALLALGLAAYAWMKHSEQCSEGADEGYQKRKEMEEKT